MSRAERRALVEREAPALPVSRQCRLLAVSRASVYRRPAEISEEDCTIIALIDRQYLARPYYGSRRMAAWLATQGHVVNRKRVRRLMRLAGLVAIYQRPNTSKPAVAHKIYPYLLGGISIERVNQVWCSDVTYIPMAKGFLYLVVIMDWVSRAVLAWRLSNTLGAEFCVEALEDALSRYGRPEIFNTDQGSQFTSDDFTGTLRRHGVTSVGSILEDICPSAPARRHSGALGRPWAHIDERKSPSNSGASTLGITSVDAGRTPSHQSCRQTQSGASQPIGMRRIIRPAGGRRERPSPSGDAAMPD